MTNIMQMNGIMEKLTILSDAAKYDVACTSSGVHRGGDGKNIGNAFASGICHAFTGDGRCISLLKILFTNECIYDCKYCVNRSSNDNRRATFTPDEVCQLTVEFYRRNYIEGLFLSSGIRIIRWGFCMRRFFYFGRSIVSMVMCTSRESRGHLPM